MPSLLLSGIAPGGWHHIELLSIEGILYQSILTNSAEGTFLHEAEYKQNACYESTNV